MTTRSLRRTRAARLARRTGVSADWIFGILAEADKHDIPLDAVLALCGARRRNEIPDVMSSTQVVDALRRRIAAAASAIVDGELEGALTGPGVRLRRVEAPPVRAVDIGPCEAEIVEPDSADRPPGCVPLVVLRPLEHRVVPAEAWAAGAITFSVAPGRAAELIRENACRIRVDTPDGEYALAEPSDLPTLPERT